MISKKAKAVAAVHDLSCVGRCALTVVIPALAAMGVQPCPLPTAVLSTHTGGYTGMAERDLTDFMAECVRHWREIDERFDAVYSGYLANTAQVDTVVELIKWQRSSHGALSIVDPVMGDGGRLYSSMPPDMPSRMLALVADADLITPNMTEVSLLTGREYSLVPMSPGEIRDMLVDLTALGAVRSAVTSVPLEGGRWANVCSCEGGEGYWQSAFDPVPAHYPGTGDLFASVMAARLTLGDSAQDAMAYSTVYLHRVIEDSAASGGEIRAGVQLEYALGYINDASNAAVPPEFIAG